MTVVATQGAPHGAPQVDPTRRRSLGARCFRAGAWLLLLVTMAGFVSGVLVPRLSGATSYAVLTGSMSPAYPPGTLLVVRPTDPDDIRVGDVVTFRTGTGESGQVVTHRVVDTLVGTGGAEGTGERLFVVKGDANPIPDTLAVSAEQIQGTVWYAVPWLGRVNVWLAGGVQGLLADIAAAALIGFGALSLVRGLRDRRRDKQEVGDA